MIRLLYSKVFLSISCLSLVCSLYSQPLPCINPTGTNAGSGLGITNVSIGILNHATPIEEGYTVEYDSSGVVIPDLGKCEKNILTVNFVGGVSNVMWIDWNMDGDFYDAGETYSPIIIGLVATYTIMVPFNASSGNRIMRIAAAYKMGDPCQSPTSGGDYEDYKINVAENDMKVDSVAVEQVMDCYRPGQFCKPVLRIAVYTTGTGNPASVTGFSLNTLGSTNATNDILNAKIIYTGDSSSSFFACNANFGNVFNNPIGAFNINGSQTLTSTNCNNLHYFWLIYDIKASATGGNSIDAQCLNISVNEQGTPSIKTPVTTSPFGVGTINTSVEICNNGLDDDCDGLVDCFDPDCAGIGNCISAINDRFYGLPLDTCTGISIPANPQSRIRNEWTYQGISVVNRFTAIGDLDNDGISEIVLNNSGTNLAILDGKTGLVKRNIAQPNYYYAHGVLADINNNGSGEIYWTTDQNKIICYDYVSNSIVWGPITYSLNLGTNISIADFNGDGVPELYDNKYIINAATGALMGQFPAGTTTSERQVAVDVLPDNFCSACQGLEIITGTHVLSVDIVAGVAVIKEVHSVGGNGNSTIADLDGDGLLDVATVTDKMLFTWNPRTLRIMRSVIISSLPVPFSTGYTAFPPSIEDIDNDNDLDFVFGIYGGGPFQNRTLIALDNTMNFMWKQFDMSDGSLSAFPVIFDLEGDGSKEIIYRPESLGLPGRSSLFILDAATGALKDSIYCKNGTYTVETTTMLADVDGDGEVEIIVNGELGNGSLELMVVGNGCSNRKRWVCARKVWNQHNYHPAFINDDLTVPKVQQNYAMVKGLNAWGIQASFKDTAGNYACPLPDVNVHIDSIKYLSCDTQNIFVKVCNIGNKKIQQSPCSVKKCISFYKGDPLSGGSLLLVDTFNSNLDTIGSCVSKKVKLYCGNQTFNLFVVVNDNGTNPLSAPNIEFSECKTSNNFDSINVFSIPIAAVISGNNTICSGDSVLLTGTGGGLYNWSIGYTTSTIYFKPSADSTIQLIVTDATVGCKDTAYQAIIVLNPAVYNQSLTAYCDSVNVRGTWYHTSQIVRDTLLGQASNGCDSIINTLVTINNTPIVTNSSVFTCAGQSISIHGINQNIAGVYSKTLTSASGCDSISSVTLSIITPVVSLVSVSGCDSAFVNGMWHTFSQTIADTLIAAAASGCDSIVNTNITINTTPVVSISPLADTINAGNNIILSATGALAYLWSDGATTSSISVTPLQTMLYCVIGANGNCLDTICTQVYVIECTSGNIFVPTAFSPNNDGQNDVLCIYGINCIKKMEMNIYDRWGGLVYHSNDAGKCWDGKYKGKLMDPGMFYFYVDALLLNNKQIKFKGNVSLLR